MARFPPVDWSVFGKEVIPSEQRFNLFQAFIGTTEIGGNICLEYQC